MLQFLSRYGTAEGKVLNNVMENYFNRKNIKPISYLKNPALVTLQTIWLKHHHVPLSELTPKSSPTLTTDPDLGSATLEQKRKQVLEMEQEISEKDDIIR